MNAMLKVAKSGSAVRAARQQPEEGSGSVSYESVEILVPLAQVVAGN